jgi:hypothetical protein
VETFVKNPALLRGEDAKEHGRIVRATMDALRPRDIIEGFLVSDVVGYAWHLRRLRQIEAELLEGRVSEAHPSEMSDEELEAILEADMRDTLCLAGIQDEEQIRRIVEMKALPGRGKYENGGARSEGGRGITAAYKEHSVELERLSRLMASAETRRNAAVRELERYRDAAPKRRQASEDIIDAEFRDADDGGRERE